MGSRYCPDCAEAQRELREAKRRARNVRKRKPCRRCGKVKQAGRRHLCDRCQAAEKAPRTCRDCSTVVPGHRRLCEPCRLRVERARRARYRARIHADPVRSEALRASQREWCRNRPARQTVVLDRGPRLLPGLPLAAALYEAGVAASGLEVVLELAGVNARTAYGWRTGRAVRVQTADQVLTRMGWAWHDIWNPERWRGLYSPAQWVDVVDVVCQAMTGERLIAP